MTSRRPFHLAVYADASVVAGAEASLATLLAALGVHVRVTVVGTDAAVVAALAEARPGSATRVCRAVRDKADVRGIVDHLRTVRSMRPDVLHVNLHTLWSCQYALAAGIVTPGVRVVAVEHTPPIAGSPFQHRLKRWTSARLAAHVAIADAVARGVEATAGLPAGSVRTIHSGVREPRVPVDAPARTGDTVGAVGRLVGEKCFDVLLGAVADIPGARLRLVGDGPERAALEAEARRLGITDRVAFRGWQADVGAELAAMDVVAVPSLFEGFGTAAVEALLAGVPVVVSRRGGMPEYVVDGETGLLVEPGDRAGLAGALRSLLGDPELRERLARAGEARVRSLFSPEASARAFEDLYDALLR
jgi:glycosyltransferase involved in cell wall biosynthesis